MSLGYPCCGSLLTNKHLPHCTKGKPVSTMAKYQVRLAAFMSNIGKTKDTTPPNKTNVEGMLGIAYMWDFIEAYAAGKSKNAWKELEENNLIMTEELEPGEYVLNESPNFICQANVTEKVRRFVPDVLVKALNKKYKVPLPVAAKMIEEAKVPTKSQVKLKIVER